MDSRTRARRGLAIFFPVLILCSAYLERQIYLAGGDIGKHVGLIYSLMWSVTFASVIARVILREGPGDISFRWGGWAGTRAFLVAWVLPVIVGTVAYGVSWRTGLAHLSVPAIPRSFLGIHLDHGSDTMRFVKFLFLSLTFLGLRSCRSAAGGEIGWRGYMLTRLIHAGVPAPLFASGFVWALWHTPLILSGQYASGPHRLVSAAIFVCSVVSIGYIFAWLRLTSGSIWPCIWAHGVWNAVIQGPFDMSTGSYSLWVGESGILTALCLATFTVVLYRIWPLPKDLVQQDTGRQAAAA